MRTSEIPKYDHLLLSIYAKGLYINCSLNYTQKQGNDRLTGISQSHDKDIYINSANRNSTMIQQVQRTLKNI